MYVNSIIEQRREQFFRQNFMTDEFLDFIKRNNIPFETLISYYRCAIMEVETKFKVLNEQYALRYDRNPIESIKSRVKSSDSLLKKIRKKSLPEKRNVKVEVQLRTIAMDSWASLEHKLKYKKNLPEEQVEEISKELKYCADMSADLDAHMQGIREQIYKDGNPKKYEDMPFIIPGMPVIPAMPSLAKMQTAARNSLAGLLGEGEK